MIKWYCDHCGEQIKENFKIQIPRRSTRGDCETVVDGRKTTTKMPGPVVIEDKMLCRGCRDLLLDYFEQFFKT